jgi:uroporphyrinogen III methyltransferase / synthase
VRVVLTGTERTSAALADDLRAEGFEVEHCPLVAVETLPGPPIQADGYDWVVLTSRNGVEALFARLEGRLPPVAVVGPGTAEALRERGVQPALVAARSTQEGLAAQLGPAAGRVLFPGAEGARDVLARELDAEVVPLYRTVELRPERFPEAELVLLASASAARSFAALALELPCVCIGPVTSREARRHGLRVVAEAESHDREGLVRAVKLVASRRDSSPS